MVNRLKIRIVMGVLFSWQGVVALEPSRDDEKSDVIQLNFERLFPESPFNQVYSDCVSFWQSVRVARNRRLSDDQKQSIHDGFIDSLVLLYGRVDGMLKRSRTCSIDDIEFLSSLLQHIQHDHSDVISSDDESTCSRVLLKRLREKLEFITDNQELSKNSM